MFRTVFQRKIGLISLIALAFLLAVGAASGNSLARHRAGHTGAARNAMSSTHLLSRAQGSRASRVSQPALRSSLLGWSTWLRFGSGSASSNAPGFAPPSGCGASGTIAQKSGFEDADGNLAVDNAGCMDWNGFAPVTWTGSAPNQTASKNVGGYSFYGVEDAVNSHDDTSYSGGSKQNRGLPGDEDRQHSEQGRSRPDLRGRVD